MFYKYKITGYIADEDNETDYTDYKDLYKFMKE